MSTIQITKPKVEISPEILKQLNTQINEMGQVVIHILFDQSNSLQGSFIRIWPTSFLYDLNSDHVSTLIHTENIVMPPQWQLVTDQCHFTLIFNGLPKDCRSFDFVEKCGNENGGFEVRNIARSESDIYYFRIG